MEFIEVKDHGSLRTFYKENGLEVSDEIESEDGAVFSIAAVTDGAVAAAATLSYRKGIFILDYIAVAARLRGTGLGSRLLDRINKRAKELNAKRVYITARRPGFFKANGFMEGQPEGVDMNEGCVGCPQYNTSCVSVPMFLELGEEYDQK